MTTLTQDVAIANDRPQGGHWLHPLVGHCAPVPLDAGEECVGCGNEKRHRGRPASSLVCCGECWRRLPQWAKDAFVHDHRRPESGPEHGATIWQHRLSILLQWMREADDMPNAKPSNRGSENE